MSSDPSATDSSNSLLDSERELTDHVWQTLQSAMASLSPMDRAVLALHNSFAFTYAEVARILGLEESEVRESVERVERTTAVWGAELSALHTGRAAGGVTRTANPDAQDLSTRPK